jgi:hypothetical protein
VKINYRHCYEQHDCEMCGEPVMGSSAFLLDRHEYDPFEFMAPTEMWLCSADCVRAWDNREPNDPSSEDSGPRDEAHRMEQARRLK